MKRFKQLYKIVSYIDEKNRDLSSDAFLQGLAPNTRVNSKEVTLSLYTVMGLKEIDIHDLIQVAISRECLKKVGATDGIPQLAVDPKKGADFLDKIGWFKIGMWSEIIGTHSTVFTIATSSVAGFIIGVFGHWLLRLTTNLWHALIR